MSGGSIQDFGRIGQLGQTPQIDQKISGGDKVQESSFGDALENALHKIDGDMQAGDKTATSYISGEGGDLHNVLIEMEKADLQFRTMMQVRNKLLEAYKEIMRMSV